MFVRHATAEGTASFTARFANRLHPSHFSQHNELWFSSVGMGIYLGGADADRTARIRDAVLQALLAGCNHFDTATTHSSQRAEQIVGQALAAAFARSHVTRSEVIVAARGGPVLFEGQYPVDAAAYVRQNLIGAGVAAADEFAQGWHHCMAPKYLRLQLRQSLTNIGLGSLDIYYVHSPEVQRVERGPEVFESRLLAAFSELEAQIQAERLAFYGIATIDGFRVPPHDPAYLSLARLVDITRDAYGPNHHFRYVQVPLNLAMREAFEFRNQVVNGRSVTLLEAARELGMVVIGGAALWQGQLAQHLPEDVRAAFPEMETNAQTAIQFARSAPGLASALVGMSDQEHVKENLAVAHWPLAPVARLAGLF